MAEKIASSAIIRGCGQNPGQNERQEDVRTP